MVRAVAEDVNASGENEPGYVSEPGCGNEPGLRHRAGVRKRAWLRHRAGVRTGTWLRCGVGVPAVGGEATFLDGGCQAPAVTWGRS